MLRRDRCGPSTPGRLPARGVERPVQHHRRCVLVPAEHRPLAQRRTRCARGFRTCRPQVEQVRDRFTVRVRTSSQASPASCALARSTWRNESRDPRQVPCAVGPSSGHRPRTSCSSPRGPQWRRKRARLPGRWSSLTDRKVQRAWGRRGLGLLRLEATLARCLAAIREICVRSCREQRAESMHGHNEMPPQLPTDPVAHSLE